MRSARVHSGPEAGRPRQEIRFQLRAGRPEDAQACGRICYEAFRKISESHNFPPDFPSAEAASGLMTRLLANPGFYSVVAQSGDGAVLGSNFLWKDTIGGVGPITVDPAVQNGSVGRSLMEEVIEYSRRQGMPGIRLIQAAYHNRSLSLYAKLGFVVREPLANMQGPPLGRKIPGYSVRRATAVDVETCGALCLRIHGHARPAELGAAVRQGTATVALRHGRVTGYATGVGFFGHAVAETNEGMKALIAAAQEFAGPGFLLPTRNAELFRWCLESGLRIVQPMTLMSLGLYNEPAGAFLPSILY